MSAGTQTASRDAFLLLYILASLGVRIVYVAETNGVDSCSQTT
jgi:hypothetical protein